ncbi:hypothetical protein NDA16_001791 [Ustilago loliicola]|nr:hypothetical protein NDA16_001791 [Ustilago loliicola]
MEDPPTLDTMNSIDPGSVPPLSAIQPQQSGSTANTSPSSHDAGSVTVGSSQNVSNNGLSNRKAAGKISRPDGKNTPSTESTDKNATHAKPSRKRRSPATYPLFQGDKPWSQRSWAYELLPFRGMWYDLRRRKPYLASDWIDGFEPRNWFTIANSVVRMYFINLMPALAYILDMNYRTDGSYGVNEVILASTLAAIVFSVFSAQPLTFVGVTGLINLVNYTQYNIFVGPWFIDFWNIELKYVFVGAPLGFLIMLLFYFDHNVSSVMAQARNYPVRKPAGFHWDFFLLGITTLVSGFLGLPAPNGLVPQAPVHTETLSVYQQVEKPDHSKRIARETLSKSKRKMRTVKQQHIVNVRVVENRLSHLIIGLLTLGTMTRPLLVVLGTMPRAVFAGIFVLVGWASIERNNITMRTLAIFRDRRLAPPDEPLNSVRRSKIALFVGIQWLFTAMTIAISATIAGIGFPVIITLLIPLRYWVVPRWFSPLELKILDAPTADADGVLASLGHEPERVTGRGVEVALDTGIAGELYHKKSLDDSEEEDDEEETAGAGKGGEKSASQVRDEYAKHSRRSGDDEEAQTGGGARSEGANPADVDEDGEPVPREGAVRTVAGIGGHQTADPERHVAAASGAGIIASGLGSGAAAAAADDRKQEAEELAEQQDAEREQEADKPKETTATSTSPAAIASPAINTPAQPQESSNSRFVEQVSEAPPSTTLVGAEQPNSPKSPRKSRYVSVENPPRGAGSPPPVQWRGVDRDPEA